MAQEYPVAQGPTPGAPASTDLMAFFPPAPSTDPPVTRTVADVGIGRVRALSHVTHAGDQTFSTSAYAADATPALDAEADGVIVMWEIPADNLGASTLAVNGLPARNLAHFPDGQAMGAGDLPRTGVVISILRNHTWYTFGLHTRWADILDRPSIMPEAEAKAGTAATERTISAIRLKAAIESLADAPQDELKAVLRVLAQKRELTRTWSNSGLTSTEGEATISSGNAKMAANFQSTEAIALDGDDSTEIGYILSDAGAGAIIFATDDSGRYLVFRSNGSKALAGEDTYGIYYNTSDILYEHGISAYGTGWSETADAGRIYIIPRHVVEGDLAAYIKTDGTNVTDAVRAAVQRRNEAVILSKAYQRKESAGSGLSAGEFYMTDVDGNSLAGAHANNAPHNIFFYAEESDSDRAKIIEGWQSGDIIQFQSTNNAATNWRAGYALEITSGFSQSGNLWHSFVKRYGDAGALPPADTDRYVRFAGEDAHRFEFGLPVFLAAAVNLFGAGGAAGKLWAYVSSATNATWRRLLDVLKADAGTAAKRADYQAALATGRVQKDIAGNSDVALSAAEAAYDSIELTGAKTGNIVVTLPAAPSGVRLLRDQSTGAFSLKVKASGQADAAAVELLPGNNVILHDGGQLNPHPAPIRKWVNSDIGTDAEAIAKNLADDDFLTITIEATVDGNKTTETVVIRWGDMDNTERVLMGLASYARSLILTKSGTTLNAKRGSDTTHLTAANSVVYAERRMSAAQALT